MSNLPAALRFVKLALLDQVGAQLGLPPNADRAPAVVTLSVLMLRTARRMLVEAREGWLGINDIPARSWRAES